MPKPIRLDVKYVLLLFLCAIKKYIMKSKLLITILVIASFVKTSQAQDEPQHAINICAIAIPVMNMYVVNYEYLHKKKHGLAVRIEYAPNLKGANTNGVMSAGVLNYRWHFSPKLKSFFVGPYVRYRYVKGSGKAKTIDYNYNVSEINFGLNGGYRWVSKNGINIVLAAGYGYSITKENISPYNSEVNDVFSRFKKANYVNTSLLDAPFYGELSIGFTF